MKSFPQHIFIDNNVNSCSIFRHNVIFKDVYREVGLLEVFVTSLHGYATLLKDKQVALELGRGIKIINYIVL